MLQLPAYACLGLCAFCAHLRAVLPVTSGPLRLLLPEPGKPSCFPQWLIGSCVPCRPQLTGQPRSNSRGQVSLSLLPRHSAFPAVGHPGAVIQSGTVGPASACELYIFHGAPSVDRARAPNCAVGEAALGTAVLGRATDVMQAVLVGALGHEGPLHGLEDCGGVRLEALWVHATLPAAPSHSRQGGSRHQSGGS